MKFERRIKEQKNWYDDQSTRLEDEEKALLEKRMKEPVVQEMFEIANAVELKEAIHGYVEEFGTAGPSEIEISYNPKSDKNKPYGSILVRTLFRYGYVSDDEYARNSSDKYFEIVITYREKEEKSYFGGKESGISGVDADRGIGIEVREQHTSMRRVYSLLERCLDHLAGEIARRRKN